MDDSSDREVRISRLNLNVLKLDSASKRLAQYKTKNKRKNS